MSSILTNDNFVEKPSKKKNIKVIVSPSEEKETSDVVEASKSFDVIDTMPEVDESKVAINDKKIKRQNRNTKKLVNKDEVVVETKDEVVETKDEVVVETKDEVVVETKDEVVVETKDEVVVETKDEVVVETKDDVVVETKDEVVVETKKKRTPRNKPKDVSKTTDAIENKSEIVSSTDETEVTNKSKSKSKARTKSKILKKSSDDTDDKLIDVNTDECVPGDCEDIDSKKQIRSFRVKLPLSDTYVGRFTGLTPYQAANKALSKYFRASDNIISSIVFDICESTRNSKKSVYSYVGSREKLEMPVTYDIKDKKTNETRQIVKSYKNILKKIKKIVE